MSEGLERLERLYDNVHRNNQYYETGLCNVDFKSIEKKLKALNILISIFDIRIVGDYLIAQRGDTCVVENLKLKQSQELINLLKEVLS